MSITSPAFIHVRRLTCAGLLVLPLAGCGGFSLWPFGAGARAVPRGLENATQYRCEGGKAFHLRLLDNGNAAWLILPERQVRLERKGDGSYSNGIAVLKLDAGTLNDTAALAWKGCKAAG